MQFTSISRPGNLKHWEEQLCFRWVSQPHGVAQVWYLSHPFRVNECKVFWENYSSIELPARIIVLVRLVYSGARFNNFF
jgi:hypothetical protein